MTDQPLVCCVCLVDGRPEMTNRAIKAFREQTYTPRTILIFSTGPDSNKLFEGDYCDIPETPELPRGYLLWVGREDLRGLTIGALRNAAAREDIVQEADIIAHWDSDDWSHPQRLTEQVALLQSSGAQCVGYNQMLFWDERQVTKPNGEEIPGPLGMHAVFTFQPKNEAWLHTASRHNNSPAGTSLMYWRHVWEQNRFPDHLPKPGVATAEDTHFLAGLRVVAVSSMHEDGEPRMVASIHGGNTSISYQWIEQDTNWERVPAWDGYCRDKMRMGVTA